MRGRPDSREHYVKLILTSVVQPRVRTLPAVLNLIIKVCVLVPDLGGPVG